VGRRRSTSNRCRRLLAGGTLGTVNTYAAVPAFECIACPRQGRVAGTVRRGLIATELNSGPHLGRRGRRTCRGPSSGFRTAARGRHTWTRRGGARGLCSAAARGDGPGFKKGRPTRFHSEASFSTLARAAMPHGLLSTAGARGAGRAARRPPAPQPAPAAIGDARPQGRIERLATVPAGPRRRPTLTRKNGSRSCRLRRAHRSGVTLIDPSAIELRPSGRYGVG